jgi:hypothetical protein
MPGARLSKWWRGARRAGLAAGLTWSGFGAPAWGQVVAETAERYELRWVNEGGAESCVSGAALARLLEQTLGKPADSSGPPELLVEGRAEPASLPLRFRLRLSFKDARTGELVGERELTTSDADCGVLTPSALLVLAMSIDPEAARDGLPRAVVEELRRSQTRGDTAPTGSATAAPRMPPTTTSEPTPTRHPEPVTAPSRPALPTRPNAGDSPAVLMALASSLDVMPELAVGASLGGRIPFGAWSMSVSALGWLSQSLAVPSSPYLVDDTVDFHAVQASLVLCRRAFDGSALYLGLCGGAGVGIRWLAAHAFAEQHNPKRAFFGPELGVELGMPLGRHWLMSAGLNALLALRRDRFGYVDHDQEQRELFAPGLVSARAFLGLGVAP